MVLTSQQKETLFQYRDKSYICSILCQQSSDWYNFLKTITNIPLIVISTSMSILNSLHINNYDMQIPNIIINAVFALMLALINNFKISEKQANFRSLNIKYIKLTHYIEDKITNELDISTKEDIRKIINDYDTLAENLDFPYPGFIKRRVKKRFYGKKTLPNILNCEVVFVNKEDNSPLIKYLNNNDKKISILIENDQKNNKKKNINKYYENISKLNNENCAKLNNENCAKLNNENIINNSTNSTNSINSTNSNNIINRTISIEHIKRQESAKTIDTDNLSPILNITQNKDFSQIKFIEDLQTK